MNKANKLRQEWRKDIEKDRIREMNLDQIRLEEKNGAIKRRTHQRN